MNPEGGLVLEPGDGVLILAEDDRIKSQVPAQPYPIADEVLVLPRPPCLETLDHAHESDLLACVL